MRAHPSLPLWAEIKRLYLAGHVAPELSQQFGISVTAIYKRSSKERWRNEIAVEAVSLAQDSIADLAAAIRQLAEVMAAKKPVLEEA